MPKIEAWKCPYEGVIFEDYDDYKRHLAALSRERCAVEKQARQLATVDAAIIGERQCQNGQELCEYILANSEAYLTRGMMRSMNSTALIKALKLGYDIQWPKLTGMKLYRVRYNDTQSNSHCAPRGKEQNCHHDKDVPRGYPGWRGNLRVWHDKDAKVVMTNPKNGKETKYRIPYFSDCVRGAGIYTGTGGGLDDGFYSDFTMFVEDFPEIEKQIIFHTLGGRLTKEVSWDSPAFPMLDEMCEARTGYIKDGDPFK